MPQIMREKRWLDYQTGNEGLPTNAEKRCIDVVLMRLGCTLFFDRFILAILPDQRNN